MSFDFFGRGGNTIGFSKSVEIVYADNPKFGDITARPTRNNPPGQGFFGGLFGGPKGNPADINLSNIEPTRDFNALPNQARDIKELFRSFDGKPQRGEFFNPYKLGPDPNQGIENNQGLNSNPDVRVEDEENL